MDANTPKPRWEDDKNRADEFMQLMAQLKRNSRQMIGAALVFGLLVGLMAGVGYWVKYGDRTTFYVKGMPEGESIEIPR